MKQKTFMIFVHEAWPAPPGRSPQEFAVFGEAVGPVPKSGDLLTDGRHTFRFSGMMHARMADGSSKWGLSLIQLEGNPADLRGMMIWAKDLTP